jgi:hypothetical protein
LVGISPIVIQLSITTIPEKHINSGILKAAVSVKKHIVEIAEHTMKAVTGTHIFFLHAATLHFKIRTMRLIKVTTISHARAI